MKPRDILLQLALARGVGPITVKKLLGSFLIEELPQLSAVQVQSCGLSPAQAASVVDALNDMKTYQEEKKRCSDAGINWFTWLDAEYPLSVKALHAPPIVLWVQGFLNHPYERSVALVGSREADHYGKMVITELVRALCSYDFAVVSGGAIGADTMAHEQCLAVGGRTIAVIGSGLLQLYPARNKKLFEDIVKQGGALISPFSSMMAPLSENFPARNRVIAGLSRLTVVVQAAAKSGALITAAFARDEGRDVAAVPGPVNHPLSAGCHALLKEGAALITNGDDLMQLLGENVSVKQRELSPEKLAFGIEKTQKSPHHKEPLVIACENPQDMDDLLLSTGMEFQELSQELMRLQLEGLLKQDFMGRWIAQ